MNRDQRDFDVVVHGATGFTGRLVSEYLAQRPGEQRWAVSGRSENRLRSLLDELGLDSSLVGVCVADNDDAAALNELASRSHVVLSTVGPYARFGTPLVEACVAQGSAYCDLAGEVQWMRAMIDNHQAAAESNGARIVHACGFDSVPSDLGVWYLQQESLARFGAPCNRVALVVRAMRGGMSGGTVASMLNVMQESSRDRDVARQLAHPYTLNPAGERDGPDGRDQQGVGFNPTLGVWTSPFVMAIINQRIVRRSNALLNYAWGRDFRYSESSWAGPGISGRLKATAAVAAMAGFVAASAWQPTREHLLRRLLPDPGEGPDRDARERGFFNLVLEGETAAGEAIRVRVTGDRDPGYGSTSRMIAESALCLAQDDLQVGGGFWTPAAALNAPLLDRLRARAGLTFDVDDD